MHTVDQCLGISGRGLPERGYQRINVGEQHSIN
jgi:hypothetical protein